MGSTHGKDSNHGSDGCKVTAAKKVQVTLEITAEMKDAGFGALLEADREYPEQDDAVAVFVAMLEAAPAGWLAKVVMETTVRGECGLVSVPSEPTKEMIDRGESVLEEHIEHGTSSNANGDRSDYSHVLPGAARAVYLAMLGVKGSS